MAARLAAMVRITSRGNAVWRECAGCAAFAPLAPGESRCRACRAAAVPARRRRANAQSAFERN